MKTVCCRALLLLLWMALFVSPPACGQSSPVDITGYDIHARTTVVDSALHVRARVELTKPGTLDSFTILLSSRACSISVTTAIPADAGAIPYEPSGQDSLRLDLPQALRGRTALTLEFDYTMPLPAGQEMLLIDRGHRWYPLIVDDIARCKLTVEVPRGYAVFASGDLMVQDTTDTSSLFVWETAIPVFKIPLVIAKSTLYHEAIRPLDGKTLCLYTTAADTNASDSILAETGRAFSYFTRLLGEYPHKRFTLVEVPQFEGMNIASTLVMVGTTFRESFARGEWDGLDLCIAQQWFGAGVFAKFPDPGFWFLSLSLPHHLRLTYLRQTRGEEAFQRAMQHSLDAYREIAGTPGDVPILSIDMPNTREKGLAIYGKGPFILDRVRQRLGDAKWSEWMRGIYQTYRGRILTYPEFEQSLAQYDPGGTTAPLLHKLVSESGLAEE
jgi:hypothetical protein